MLFLEEVWQAGQPDSVHCVLYRDDIYTSAVWEELKADVGRSKHIQNSTLLSQLNMDEVSDLELIQ